MSSVEALLVSLQLGDTFFPSGAGVHSHGLEGLLASGDVVGVAGLEAFLNAQLEHRWASAERVVVHHAHAAAGDPEKLASLDRYVDRSTAVSSWRLGGRRLGRALLRTHQALGTPHCVGYAAWVQAGRAPGQAGVVHGLVGFALGLAPAASAALSAYGLAVGIVGAGLRLGAVGHLDAQRLLMRQRARTLELLDRPLPPLDELGTWVPAAEIASMVRETHRGRLFAT